MRPYEVGAAPIPRGDVIAAAWHTEIGVAATDIHGALTVLVSDFPRASEGLRLGAARVLHGGPPGIRRSS